MDQKIYFFLKKILSIIFIILLILYSIYHIYNGKFTIKNYINKEKIIEEKNIKLKILEKDIEKMQNKIDNLQDNNLDSDILDEEIRKNTGYSKEKEIIIYSNNLKQ